MTDNTFICALCKEEFNKGWSDEDAIEEYQKGPFGGVIPLDETALVCDDCYNMMMAAT